MLTNINDIQKFCSDNNIELLYLTRFGSKLYGTDNERSDEDLKGIFLPSKESLLLNRPPKFSQFSSGSDNSRNSSEDIDVELYSLHNFLSMVERGETGAIDLLFSPSNESAVIFKDPRIDLVFDNPLFFFNPLNTRAFMGYAQSQAKKYSMKGSYLNVLSDVSFWLDEHKEFVDLKLKDFIDELLKECENGNFCCKVQVEAPNKKDMIDALQLLGSTHTISTSYEELNKRVKKTLDRYGSRAKNALNSVDKEVKDFLKFLNKENPDSIFIECEKGCYDKLFRFEKDSFFYKSKEFPNSTQVKELIEFFNKSFADWKAISHAVRCVLQTKELLITKKIQFPLKEREYIKCIKEGKEEFSLVMEKLDFLILEVNDILDSTNIKNSFNKKYVDNFILSFYR